ncbi:serine/threonine protein kinase [Chamaesiphon polymorphus]|nr:hypothetical protein [Chamaesiphon polymorphus]
MMFKNLFSKRSQTEEAYLSKPIETSLFKSGDIIRDRYCVKKQILACKSTGWDETYLAIDRDSTDLKQVVIKYLKLNIGRGRSTTAGILFDREMDKLAHLSSQVDCIPRFHDRFQDRDEFYLVQEYVAGRNMAEILANVRLSELETVSFIKTILSALQSIHDRDIIYKYMRLNNIVLRSVDGKLGFLYCGDITNIIEMKPPEPSDGFINHGFFERYKAPEVLALKPQLSSDIFAVGAIGIQCLVGCSLNELAECPSTGEIKWRDHCQVSDRFADILNKMYEQSQRYRYNNVTEVLDALDKLYS